MEQQPSTELSIGTLRYTSAQLFRVIFWLLLGGAAMSLIGTAFGTSILLLLKKAQASNTQTAIIIVGGSIYSAMNFIMNPIVSSLSDRTRTPWGRRRPFLLWSIPFVMAGMILLPYASDFAMTISQDGALSKFSGFINVSLAILGIGVLGILFYFGYFFVASVYYYFFPDVIPNHYIGRFIGYFRIAQGGTLILYNYFIFKYLGTNIKEILLGIAILYGIVIILMCIFVKEGKYPPPPPKSKSPFYVKTYNAVKGYVVDCFSIKYYWLIFSIYILWGITCVGGGMMLYFQQEELKLSLEQIGYIGVFGQFLIFLNIPAGMLVDKFRGFHMLTIGFIGYAIACTLNFFFIQGFYSMLFLGLLESIPLIIIGISLSKVLIDVYPREKYGQFCSASAMLSSFVLIVFAIIIGKFFDIVGVYRSIYLWRIVFVIPAIIITFPLYRAWRKRQTPAVE